MGLRDVLSNFAKFARESHTARVIPNRSPEYYGTVIEKLKAQNKNNLIEINRQISAIYTPDFALYNTMTNLFPEVAAIQDKIINRIIGAGGYFIDQNGEEQILDIDFEHSSREFLQSILTFGQALLANVRVNNEDKDIIIPSHQITLWQATGFEIDAFSWQHETQLINFDKKNESEGVGNDFYLFRGSNPDSMFFGKSKLLSLYTILNTLHSDREAFNLFLENNSFPGLLVFTKEGVTPDEILNLATTMKELNSKNGRYKAILAEGVEKIEQVKQDVQFKISQSEYENILNLICYVYNYPVQLLRPTGGLGQGEQKSHLIQLRDESIKPLQKQLETFINYILKKNKKIKNLKWKANEIEIESKSDIIASGVKLFENGIISGKVLKTKYLGFELKELTSDDDYRQIKNNVILVKEGEMSSTPAPTPASEPIPVEPKIIPKSESNSKNKFKFNLKTKKK